MDSSLHPEGSSPAHSANAPKRENLHGEIVSRLRDFIVEGHLEAGERVPERSLCERFGVSRTPLREALKVLAAEGLVQLLPNKGARVRQFTGQNIRDSFEMLAALESAAGRLACARITETEISEIEQLHYAMYGHYMRRELPGYFRLNQAIHEKIMAASGNHALQTTYARFTAPMRRLRYSANTLDNSRWGQAMREHEEILDALRRREGAELATILFVHLLNKWRAAFEAVPGRDNSVP